jgi:hypothetical protein
VGAGADNGHGTYCNRLSFSIFAKDPEWHVAGVPPVVPHAESTAGYPLILLMLHDVAPAGARSNTASHKKVSATDACRPGRLSAVIDQHNQAVSGQTLGPGPPLISHWSLVTPRWSAQQTLPSLVSSHRSACATS